MTLVRYPNLWIYDDHEIAYSLSRCKSVNSLLDSFRYYSQYRQHEHVNSKKRKEKSQFGGMNIEKVNAVVDHLVSSRKLLFDSKITVLTPILRLNIIEKEKTIQRTEELVNQLISPSPSPSAASGEK